MNNLDICTIPISYSELFDAKSVFRPFNDCASSYQKNSKPSLHRTKPDPCNTHQARLLQHLHYPVDLLRRAAFAEKRADLAGAVFATVFLASVGALTSAAFFTEAAMTQKAVLWTAGGVTRFVAGLATTLAAGLAAGPAARVV